MSFADDFLADADPRTWNQSGWSSAAIRPRLFFLGRGEHALEVAVGEAGRRPKADEVRALWHARQRKRPSPLLTVVGYPDGGRQRVTVCGSVGDNPPLVNDLDPSQVERLAATALGEPTRHAAVRFLVAMLPEVGSDLPGLRNAGLLATQELRHGVPTRADWEDACRSARPMLGLTGQKLVERLGFAVKPLQRTGSVLTVGGARRAVAVFLDETETFEDPARRFGTSPVSHALALADQEALPWVVLTRGRQIRLYAARPDTGVGRKGRAATYVELNLALLAQEQAGYLTLLFGGHALDEGGALAQILDRSADFAAELGARLRDRVYFDAVPTLAAAIAARLPQADITEDDLDEAYKQTLVVLFRLLFVAYAEDKDLLPYRTNSRYHDHSLKLLSRRLNEWKAHSDAFDTQATDLWDDVRALWNAVHGGNIGWGVPAYDGGLFSSDPKVNQAGAALARISLSDAEFGPALTALLVDHGPDDVLGPVDFRSLSVREFGTLYEGLLESRLSVAPSDLTVDSRGSFVPARARDDVKVTADAVYFHHRSGSRKATGSYFTKPFAVEHLLNHALEPVLDDHVARLTELVQEDDEAAAARAFFDFRCVDLAMGSGHFLVAAVDRIEARLAGFLALHPIPLVLAELEELRSAALAALGDLADGVEIETASLLRRQVARRCMYGVDRNPMAVELARLAMWIHTFVPGLPLSFLSHGLVEGDSLTGIGTLDEALDIIDPEPAPGHVSLYRDQIEAFLGRARSPLRRLAATVEKTTRDVEASRAAQAEALEAVKPARDLFNLLISARLGEAAIPPDVDEDTITTHRQATAAKRLAGELNALHFPVAFPEVFLRERPGFDVILGNPPWEKVKVEKHAFWGLRFPGLRSMPVARQNREVAKLERQRPDLIAEYKSELAFSENLRAVLRAGYPEVGAGDPDLFKAFCWRFWALVRSGGAIGVVLPRSAFAATGNANWRRAVLDDGTFSDVTMTVNTGGWVFDDAEPRYTIGFVTVRREAEDGVVRIRGPFASRAAYRSGMAMDPLTVSVDELKSWSSKATFPLLPDPLAADVFLKMRRAPRLDAADGGWRARPVLGDLHATQGKPYMTLDPQNTNDLWPVYSGGSFNLWSPDNGPDSYYAWIKPTKAVKVLQDKRVSSARRAGSVFSGFGREWVNDRDTLPCRHPRLAFRDVARATDSRTVIIALIPGDVVVNHKAPYLLWPAGDERDQAYLLGVMACVPFDWYARRMVENSVNFDLLSGFPVPRPGRDDPLRRRVEQIAGRLAAVDERYRPWAEAVDVSVASVRAGEREDLVAELDAAVALLYGLDMADVRHIFETFHVGWAYQSRLHAVLAHYERLAHEHAR